MKVLGTMAEKIAAYRDFFASGEETHLIVVGMHEGGEGKSAALKLYRNTEGAKLGQVVVYAEDIPFVIPPQNVTDEPSDDVYSTPKTVHHLNHVWDELLIKGLVQKYGTTVKVVHFARGSE